MIHGTGYALLVYVLLQVAFSAWVARKVKTEADYLVAGRNLGFFLVSISLFATWFGAETVMGASGAVAFGGLSAGRADPFGYTICLLLMALFLAYQMRSRNYLTLGDYFRDRFGAKAEKLGVLIMIPTSLLWASAQLVAFSTIFASVTGIDASLSLIIATFILVTYSSLGGMIGDVVTDVVEGGVVVIGLLIMLGVLIMRAGGLDAAFSSIAPERLNLLSPEESLLAQLDGWMVPVLGSLVAQEAMSRMLAARSPELARRAAIGGSFIYLAIGSIPLLIGLIGGAIIEVPEDTDSFLPLLAQEILPPFLYVLLLGALISAILSTINSTLLAITGLAGHNLIAPLFPHWSEYRKMIMEKGIVVVAGIICYVLASSGESIYGLVELASSFGSAGLVVCVLIGLNSRFGNELAGLLTLLTGIALTLLTNYVIELEAPYLASLLGCIVVYALTAMLARKNGTVKHAE